MYRLLPITLALFLLVGGVTSSRAQKATLVIDNHTDATLTIFAVQVYRPYETTAEMKVGPGESLRFPSFLPRGTVDVLIDARLVRPAVDVLAEQLHISGASPRTQTLEISPGSFGRSVLTDTATEEATGAGPPAGNESCTPNFGKYSGLIGTVEVNHYPGACEDHGFWDAHTNYGRDFPAAYWTVVNNVQYYWRNREE